MNPETTKTQPAAIRILRTFATPGRAFKKGDVVATSELDPAAVQQYLEWKHAEPAPANAIAAAATESNGKGAKTK
jgi:hypothetical protein